MIAQWHLAVLLWQSTYWLDRGKKAWLIGEGRWLAKTLQALACQRPTMKRRYSDSLHHEMNHKRN